MEHDQRICPRCGKPAGEYRFCDSCRAHIDSLTRVSSRVEIPADDAATQARQAVLRLEQALAAASEWSNDRVTQGGSATAVETEPAPTETRSADVETPPAVARFEEVMTVAPKAETSVAPPAPQEVASVEPPVAPVEPPVAPVEPPAASVEPPAAPVEPPAAPVASVAPPATRKTFWFEVAPTLKSESEPGETSSVAPPTAAPEVNFDHQDSPGSPGPWLMVLFILALLTFFLSRRSSRR